MILCLPSVFVYHPILGWKIYNQNLLPIYHHVYVVILIMLLAFLKGKTANFKKIHILSYGFNMAGDDTKNDPGIHAEHDAINKLKPIRKKKHLHNVNLLVIRLSKFNKLQNSKPCANCIENLKHLPQKRGYRIRTIYYSNEHGEIVKNSLTQLEKDELHYTRFFRKFKK